MNKIILVTTKGCEGCAIMAASIRKAIAMSTKDINYGQTDVAEIPKSERDKYKLKDFPTILMFVDNKLKYKYSGTMPAIVIVRWIDINSYRKNPSVDSYIDPQYITEISEAYE